MNCDGIISDRIPYPLPNTSFFMAIIGTSGQGKTNLVLNLLTNKYKFYNKCFDRVISFSNSIHTIENAIKLPNEQIYNGLDFDHMNNEIEIATDKFKEDNNQFLVIYKILSIDIYKWKKQKNYLIYVSGVNVKSILIIVL